MSLSRYPENTETSLYINCGIGSYPFDFLYMMDSIKSHFGEEISLEELDITAEHINTRCIGYDLYDSSDYDNYIVITRK